MDVNLAEVVREREKAERKIEQILAQLAVGLPQGISVRSVTVDVVELTQMGDGRPVHAIGKATIELGF